MKIVKAFVGLSLCLAGIASASAQANKCNAVITKQSVSLNKNKEKTWNVEFNLAVTGCDTSTGTFEYVAELESNGRTELKTVKESFDAGKAGNSTFTVSFHAPPGKSLKDVKGASVKTCTCAP